MYEPEPADDEPKEREMARQPNTELRLLPGSLLASVLVSELVLHPGPGWQRIALGRVESEAGALLLLDIAALVAGPGESLAA